MKRFIGFILLFTFIVSSGMFTALPTVSASSDLSINYQKFFKYRDIYTSNEVYALTLGEFFGKIEVTNNNPTDSKSVSLIVAAYNTSDESKLEQVSVQTKTIAAGATTTVSNSNDRINLSTVTSIDNYMIKLIVVDNLSTLTPLTKFRYISSTTQPVPYNVYDDMNDTTKMLSKSNNVGVYQESMKTKSYTDTPYVSNMARRDGANTEGYITYQLNNNPLSQITVDAYFYDNYNYAGLTTGTTGDQRLNAILSLEGLKFYQSTDNSYFTEITNPTLIKEVSPWPGITGHHVTYVITGINSTSKYFKIYYPGNSANTTYTWSTRVDLVCFEYSAGGDDDSSQYGWVNPSVYTRNKISVVSPQYASTINGDDCDIVVCAPGMTTPLTAKTWKQDSTYGSQVVCGTVNLDSRGVGAFTFPASQYPHGPIIIDISGYAGSTYDECSLQLYNNGGVSWNEGLANAPTPPQLNGLGLSMVYQDDFNTPPSISWDYRTGKTYSSHKPGYQDFSGIGFQNYEDTEVNPFSTVETYLRIRANQNINSTGLISSLHQDRSTGFAVKAPAYFECKFIAQNAKGTWPAFWLLTTLDGSEDPTGNDELDVIEAYGFDPSQPQFNKDTGITGYSATRHNWDQAFDISQNDHSVVDMTKVGGHGVWSQGFHTYGCLIKEDYTIYYCDNVEIWRHETMPKSQQDYIYFLINLAVGGISGWPYDLSRYNGISDMYIDWVRVYGDTNNLMNK